MTFSIIYQISWTILIVMLSKISVKTKTEILSIYLQNVYNGYHYK